MQNGDRNAFASSAVPSLADVAVRIGAIDQISAARKAAIRSAINTASRWFKLPATAIPAHPEFLRRLFAAFSPAAVGATPKRVSNVKSDLLFALRRLGLLARGSYLAPFAPEWQALWRRLPDRYARTTLSRFFRYCSAQGVQPVLVTDEVAASFLTPLETETLVKQPRVVHQNVARLWNRMRAQVPGWPTVELTVPRYADHYILPASPFPRPSAGIWTPTSPTSATPTF
jgi:hypothetical protein